MFFGFTLILFSASAGFFLSTEHVRAHVEGGAELLSWWMQLASSAHGHTNLFGMLHIMLGLTFPYCASNKVVKLGQTIGLALGSASMGILMLIRAESKPSLDYDIVGVLIGLGLGAAIVSIATQVLTLLMKLVKNPS